MNNTIHATVREFAIKHRINIGRMENGYYFIGHGTEQLHSYEPTAKSGLALCRRFLGGR